MKKLELACCHNESTVWLAGDRVDAALDFAGVIHADRPHLHSQRWRYGLHCRQLAPLDHSITSSARASSVSGTVRPNAFAVLRLITRSYLVGACTGRPGPFSPPRRPST